MMIEGKNILNSSVRGQRRRIYCLLLNLLYWLLGANFTARKLHADRLKPMVWWPQKESRDKLRILPMEREAFI